MFPNKASHQFNCRRCIGFKYEAQIDMQYIIGKNEIEHDIIEENNFSGENFLLKRVFLTSVKVYYEVFKYVFKIKDHHQLKLLMFCCLGNFNY